MYAFTSRLRNRVDISGLERCLRREIQLFYGKTFFAVIIPTVWEAPGATKVWKLWCFYTGGCFRCRIRPAVNFSSYQQTADNNQVSTPALIAYICKYVCMCIHTCVHKCHFTIYTFRIFCVRIKLLHSEELQLPIQG